MWVRLWHHNLVTAVLTREETSVETLLATIQRLTNPFLEGGTELFNLITKVVMPENGENDLCIKRTHRTDTTYNVCQRAHPVRKDKSLVTDEEKEAFDMEEQCKSGESDDERKGS